MCGERGAASEMLPCDWGGEVGADGRGGREGGREGRTDGRAGSEERREGKSVDLGGRRIIKKTK